MIGQFLLDDSGSTALEYAFIAGLVAVGAVAGFTALAASVGAMFDVIATDFVDNVG